MSAAIQDTSAHRPAPLPWLTALRYPAAVWVVALHCWLKVGSMADISRIVHTPVGMFVDRGYLGVSFFFMLSGFILVWNYPVISSIKGYLTARAARILPVYYLALLFSLPVLIVTIRGEGFHLFQVIKGLMVLTLTQSWYPKIAGFWNGPGWTLSCEAFFYCSLPWLLPLVTRHFSGKSLKRVAAWLVLLWLAGLVAPSLFFVKYGGAVNYSTWWAATQGDPALGTGMQMKHIVENFPLLRVVEFIAGTILCAGLKPHLGAAPQRRAVLLLAAGAGWVGTSLFLPFIFSMGTWCLPGFACIIAGAAMLPAPALGYPPFRAALLLGNASYAVYLFHMPILSYLLMLCPARFCGGVFSPMQFLLLLITITLLLTTLASMAIFLRFEEPMRVRLKNLLSAPRGRRLFPVQDPAVLTTDL